MQAFDLAALPIRIDAAARRNRLFHPDGVLAEGILERIARPSPKSLNRSPLFSRMRSPSPMMQKAGVDRLQAPYSAIAIVRRGGTVSLSGVCGGMADPLPMLTLFDKQTELRMGRPK